MLLVKTLLKVSAIHGLGLIADEDIGEGQEIWRFSPGFDLHLEIEEVDALPEVARSQILHYAYLHPSKKSYVLCADDARFFNHSMAPNCLDFAFDSSDDAYTLAARPIAKGEELTVDYHKFEARFTGVFD